MIQSPGLVDRRVFRQPVFDDDPDRVALVDLDRGAGHRAVEAPDIHLQMREQLALDRHRDQVKFLGPVAHRVQGSLVRSGASTGTGGRPGLRRPATSLPRSVGLPTGPPRPGRSRGYPSFAVATVVPVVAARPLGQGVRGAGRIARLTPRQQARGDGRAGAQKIASRGGAVHGWPSNPELGQHAIIPHERNVSVPRKVITVRQQSAYCSRRMAAL